MNTLQTNYQALVIEENEVPHESVIFHAASEGGKPHWNHIGDLDTFFKNVYEYHQKRGFRCIIIEEIKKTIVPLLIIFGLAYVLNGINFNFDAPSSPLHNKTDIEMGDLFLSPSQAAHNFGLGSWLIVVVGILTMVWKLYKLWQTYSTYDDIRHFYTLAMKIDEDRVRHLTWHQVQCRLREVQHEQQMCVHKSDLTELDISHRILRHTNYLVAMVNKNVLPVKNKIPVIGNWTFMTSAFEFALYILFFSRFSPVFKETGKLREEFKRYARRKEAAASLERSIRILILVCVVLCPFLFLYSMSSLFLKYAADLRYSPNRLSSRQWSRYARHYLRHFNELNHEMEARLARAYKPANEYMKSFFSPVTVIISRTLSRLAGAVAVFFFLWGLAKERLFGVGGVLILISLCYFVYVALSALVPEENVVYFPKRLMRKIIAEIHYIPDHFKENAQMPFVRDEFSELYQYKFVSIVEESLSCLFLPFLLYLGLLPRSLEVVDFFRSFTVEVAGVGDVCSFALMDVSRHGNKQWLSGVHTKADHHQQAEGGKTELSLIHFTLMNPDWKPPPSSDLFINDFRQRVFVAREEQDIQDPYYTSLNSLSTMGSKYASLVRSMNVSQQDRRQEEQNEELMGGAMMSMAEGPPYLQGGILQTSVDVECEEMNPLEMRAADMSFSALYMHEVHQRFLESPLQNAAARQPSQESQQSNENDPLLEVATVQP